MDHWESHFVYCKQVWCGKPDEYIAEECIPFSIYVEADPEPVTVRELISLRSKISKSAPYFKYKEQKKIKKRKRILLEEDIEFHLVQENKHKKEAMVKQDNPSVLKRE